MNPFKSPEPEVVLTNCFNRPFDNAVAAARTCYSSRGIVSAEEVAGLGVTEEQERRRKRQRRDALATDIFKAGHHTVFQHAQLQFALNNVSRQFVWSFLHSHPFYNSEQVSQRYVEVKPGTYLVPPLAGDALTIYESTIAAQFDAYRKLIVALHPVASQAFFAVFPARRRDPERWQKDIQKKAMEVARYVLPVATFTYLYHSISALTLLRYHRLCNQWDAPAEQRFVVGRMVEELLKVSPEHAMLLEEPIALEDTVEYQVIRPTGRASNARDFIEAFDASLDGRVSKLVDTKLNNEKLLADSVREVLGLPHGSMSDEEAIALVMNPARNLYLGDPLNLTSHSKLTRAMVHPNYTFRKKMSHAGDSQDQRHRMTPASRPCLIYHLTDSPDTIVPELVKHDESALCLFNEIMERTWEGINELRSKGVSEEFAMYLLPNAVSVRYTESADLMSLWHKFAMRLCYNAQEEIWKASVDEAEQIRAINPNIGRYLLPPCGLRNLAGLKPVCPEGKRYCGVPVWKLELEEYERII